MQDARIKNKKKIIYFHQDGLITGSLISLKTLILSLNKDAFEAHVVLPQQGPAVSFLENDGIKVSILHFNTFWTSPGPRCFSRDNIKQWTALLPNKKIKAFIKQNQPDIIHLNDKAVLNIGLSCSNLGIPIVQHCRSAYHITACTINKVVSARSIKKYANHLICISEDEEHGFEKFDNRTIVFNSVSQEACQKAIVNRTASRNNLKILEKEVAICVAENLGVYKGFFDVINLAESLLVKQKLNHVKLIIAGNISRSDSLLKYGFNGSSAQYLENFIHKHNLTQQITVLGFRTDILSIIAACDVMLISKAHGVLGRQAIEAQSLGLPVVAMNGHSRRSTIVKQGITGFLCNNLSELEEKLIKVLLNTELRKNLAKVAYTHAELAFNPTLNTKKVEAIYQQLLSN